MNHSRGTAKVAPIKNDMSTEYTVGGTPRNRGLLTRLNPTFFLTIFSAFFILVIIAALIVFTFLPIFSTARGDQSKYQVRSDVLRLVYNLPDRVTILAMNWTYEINDLESDKLLILQNLLQDLLNNKKVTRKTSIVVMDAFITREESPSKTKVFISPVTLDSNNNTIIIITQSDNSTQKNATTQLIISLRLRYALECTKKCQNDTKDSIFAKIFYSLEVPLDTFQQLFTNNIKVSTEKFFPSSSFSSPETTTTTTANPCPTTTSFPVLATSTPIAITYEAESLLNTFISTTIESCLACSNELKVSRIGYGNELIFQQLVSPYGGSTIITFYYTTDRIRSAEIIINEILPSINITFPAISTTEEIASFPLLVNLCQGLNSIRIYNPNDYTPDFDRIVVY